MSSAAALAPQEALGTIRNYVLLDEIGRGAHGTVYQAYSRERPSEIVALKVIEDNASIDRLLIEPQLLSKLRHRNIVGLKDYFLHGGKVVLVMEYVQGPDLAAYVEERGPCPASEVRAFLCQMADALAHAHASEIFHSDLKPKNILVDLSEGKPRFVIVDFGVSRIAGGIQLTRYFAGTCAFMAPEQLRGRGTLQSDLWALGTLAYMLLTGVSPFSGKTMEEIRRRILYEQPPFPPELVHEDATLERIVVRLLEKNTVDRPQSAVELSAELSGKALDKATPNESGAAETGTPKWENNLQLEVRRHRRRIAGWALVASLPEVIPVLLSCFGAWVIFAGQTRRRSLLTFLGFAVLASAAFQAWLIDALVQQMIGKDGAAAVTIVSILFGFFALPAAANFVKYRRAVRELRLLESLRTANREQALGVLRQYVTAVPGDMSIRQRYIQALLAAGMAAEAAVEARLVLDLDPYNLPTTLLLAHAYLELGLLDRCEQVCNGYLEISGQCFEFEELRQAAIKRKEAA